MGLGSGSRQGDLPGAGGGGSGEVAGAGSGSGAGPGPGSGSGGASGGGDGGAGATGSSASGGGAASGGGGSHVSRLADRTLPALVRRVNPLYPVAAQVEGVQGSVKLRVTVTKEGKVSAVKVVTSSGDARLDGAAISAVKQWRYRPAVQDGMPREVATYATLTFSLE
ncbi:MAG TPA: energy transducer TonB [Armatimonadota bacterium]|nr:energy transducer TonB [Armatimonadota bacterium]